MLNEIPIGIDDFRLLREKNYQYVDKTRFVTEFIDRESIKVILIPRPRRFGKSLNLSTLKWFFQKSDENLWHLFDGLHVAHAGDKYRAHFQKYPVIHLSFKETKATSFEACLTKAKENIQTIFKSHQPELEGKLSAPDAAKFGAILNGTASQAHFELALKHLTEWLHEVHGVRPIVLIDEYDAGIHAAYSEGFYKESISFFASFFLAGLKDNSHLERALMTGILRVSRESIFSDLNNIGVYSLLRTEFNTCFGFTEPEVEALLEEAGLSAVLPDARAYYNGYEFGRVTMYNPWSILSFLANVDHDLVPYWLGTSSNKLIKELLQHHAFTMQEEIETLLEGKFIERNLDENVVFPELKTSTNSLWNLLVFSGYLKAVRPGPRVVGQAPPPYQLSIPNREVDSVYRSSFRTWMDEALMGRGGGLRLLLDALLQGDTYEFELQLQNFASSLPSYHDVRGTRPETFYHGMMIGLLAALEPEYEVRSNRESGDGRPDVLIKPRRPGKPGVILELNSARKGEKTIEQAVAEGLAQFEENDYAAELRNAGVESIAQMVIAFDGKRVMVLAKGAKPPKKKSAAKMAAKTPARKTTKKATKKTPRKAPR
jgi:Predicted AAA-ATPase/PD-(D/E)XK nuclease superfamily